MAYSLWPSWLAGDVPADLPGRHLRCHSLARYYFYPWTLVLPRKFQPDRSTGLGLVRIRTDGQTDRRTDIHTDGGRDPLMRVPPVSNEDV